VIKSEVDLGASAVGQRQQRPMMGQSPYVANAGVYYDDKTTDLRLSLQWNVFGERLYAVGSDLFPDIYEMPRHSLDLTLAKGFGKHFELKAGVQDILNQRVLLKQDSNGDGSVTDSDDTVMSFRRGQYLSAGFTYRF
jgi:outer membrane receptor protein involved in Fe transport